MDQQPTLDEWVAMTPSERNRLRAEWRGPDVDFHDPDWDRRSRHLIGLLQQATERFKAEHGHHPLINYIAFTPQVPGSDEPHISVITSLRITQRIEELPDRYLTFAVRQEPIADMKQSYLKTWGLILGHFLGWSKEQVRHWAREHWENGLDGKEPLFYHEDPNWYVARLLIPDGVMEKLGRIPRHHLPHQIAQAIGDPMCQRPYDWAAAEARLRKALEEAMREQT